MDERKGKMPNLVFLFKYCIYNVHFSIYFNNLGQTRVSIKKIRNKNPLVTGGQGKSVSLSFFLG
jgi:hypothetical protein